VSGGRSRWRAICAYDGTDFTGWQSQASRDAVQDRIEEALGRVLPGAPRIHGASRTDAGVHARGQVFHFDAAWAHPAEALRRACHAHLPATVRLRQLETAAPDFHARHDARGKRYLYRIGFGEPDPLQVRYRWYPGRPLDVGRLRAALPALCGQHDFSAFAGRVDPAENPVKTLRGLAWEEEDGGGCLRVEGDGFLYRMVRSLAGTLVRVAAGRLDPARPAALLHGGVRTPEVDTAPAAGLILDEVFYG